MIVPITVASFELDNGFRKVKDMQGLVYTLSKYGDLPDLVPGQSYEVEVEVKTTVKNGKTYTNRYIQKILKPSAIGTPAPTETAKPNAKYTPADLKAFEKKDEYMAKMNAYNNGVAMAVAYLKLCASLPNPTETPDVTLKKAEGIRDSAALGIYLNITGKPWEGFVTEAAF